MSAPYSSSKSSDRPVINFLISSLLLDTREEAYLESLKNKIEYSLIYIPPCLNLMHSHTLASLCSLGENLYSNVVLKTSQVMGTCPGARPYRHILCHNLATPFNSQVSLFLFINTHSTQNLKNLIHKQLGIHISLGPIVH